MRRTRRRGCVWIVVAASLAAAACHDPIDTAPPALTVSALEPGTFVAFRAMAFTVRGTGFVRSTRDPIDFATGVAPATLDTTIVVTFRTADGTPFGNGTAAEVQVAGTVLSDTEIQGTLPATNAPGVWTTSVSVADPLGSGTSTEPLATFAGLTVLDISTPEIQVDAATPFSVIGLSFLPLQGNATVRLTSVVPGAFPGGADTLDVPATVDSLSVVTGTAPVLALGAPIRAYVGVVLDDEPGQPAASSTCVIVDLVPPPVFPVVVSTITSPLPLAVPTPFTITGSGFLGAGDPDVEVTFSTTPITPYARGTASSVTVLGNATSDTTVVGTSPTGTATANVDAFVTVKRADGVAGTSSTAIAQFTPPAEAVTTFAPVVLPSDTPTPFTITGTNLPASQTCIVRFRATSGAPFAGGTAESADVTAIVTSPTQIDGVSPVATTSRAFAAEVTVILPNAIEMPMGPACVCVPPPAGLVVTNLDDAGPGSLRAVLLAAPAGSTITFAEGLSGTLHVESPLTVPVSVAIANRRSAVIRIDAQQQDHEVFTIAAAATDTLIEGLAIGGSRHQGDGGAFHVLGALTLDRCELSDNQTRGAGAGVFVATGGSVALRWCTLRDNATGKRGGAVFVQTGGTATATGCTFHDNVCDQAGGAITTEALTTFTATNCTVQGNRALGGSGGGGILIATGAVASLVHCTIAENYAHNRGGGVLNQGALTATNCIFARNADARGDVELSNQGTNDTTFSLIRVGAGSDVAHGVGGNLVGTKDTPIDADLGPLHANGGPTETMALDPKSPAIGAATAATATLLDQRFVQRPVGAGPDMGAYEATVTL